MKILVTGAAGFIGFHLIKKLIDNKYEVVGIDNINDYYDTKLKYNRLKELGIFEEEIKEEEMIKSRTTNQFAFAKIALEDSEATEKLFTWGNFAIVCNLAAQAGVRYSLEQPLKYINSNVVGFTNILEACKNHNIQHFVYASSSSVYGLNAQIPFDTIHTTDHPVSLYAATKKSNELLAHVYSHLYSLPTTGLRFFTVYGPWGRPDMAYFSFTKAIIEKKPINVFNDGNLMRDFTFIDDVVEGIYKVIQKPAQPDPSFNKEEPIPSKSIAPYRIYNIGNNKPINLLHFIEAIENELKIPAIKQNCEMQPGDVYVTFANVDDLMKDFDYRPKTTLQEGMKKFIDWYKAYYHIALLTH